MDDSASNYDIELITGRDPALSHNRIIANGSFADVHEVNLLVALAHIAIQQSNRGGTHNFSYPRSKLIQVFARKIMRPFAQISRDNILSEIRAVTKLCNSESDIHGRHIVAVLNTGDLPAQGTYIDMELCAFDLDSWLYDSRDTHLAAKLYEPLLWDIIAQITSGVIFIHSHGMVHRDLKPQNGMTQIILSLNVVLFSEKSRIWKVGDFGLTCEGSSTALNTTKYGRGTKSYRAPELLLTDGGEMNKKTDIWALGCILYELMFRKKAFASDYEVHGYNSSNDLRLEVDQLQFTGEEMVQNLRQMLQKSAKSRPSAESLYTIFRHSQKKAVIQTFGPLAPRDIGTQTNDPGRSVQHPSPSNLSVMQAVVNRSNTCVAVVVMDVEGRYGYQLWTIARELLWEEPKPWNLYYIRPVFSNDGQIVGLVRCQKIPQLIILRVANPMDSLVDPFFLNSTRTAICVKANGKDLAWACPTYDPEGEVLPRDAYAALTTPLIFGLTGPHNYVDEIVVRGLSNIFITYGPDERTLFLLGRPSMQPQTLRGYFWDVETRNMIKTIKFAEGDYCQSPPRTLDFCLPSVAVLKSNPLASSDGQEPGTVFHIYQPGGKVVIRFGSDHLLYYPTEAGVSFLTIGSLYAYRRRPPNYEPEDDEILCDWVSIGGPPHFVIDKESREYTRFLCLWHWIDATNQPNFLGYVWSKESPYFEDIRAFSVCREGRGVHLILESGDITFHSLNKRAPTIRIKTASRREAGEG